MNIFVLCVFVYETCYVTAGAFKSDIYFTVLLIALPEVLNVYSFQHFQLYYLRLPKDIKDYKVILMDATVATGAAAMMAIRVLLDHDVPEENILIVSLLMAEIGKQELWTL